MCQEQFLFIFPTCRSEKESLQCSLLEAQQHVSQLEITRSHLEGQVCSATQAKELILSESLCLYFVCALFLVMVLPGEVDPKPALSTGFVRSEGAGDRTLLA